MRKTPRSEAPPSYEPQIESGVERKPEKFIRTSRVYMLQAKSAGEIAGELEKGDYRPGDMYFTNTVVMQKTEGSRNVGDILPVGGKRKEEDVVKSDKDVWEARLQRRDPLSIESFTAAREGFEEAGPMLRPEELLEMGKLQYLIEKTDEQDGKEVITPQNTVTTFYFTQVAPGPYVSFHVRNKGEDKGKIIKLDWRKMHQLLYTGLLSDERGVVAGRMMDSLTREDFTDKQKPNSEETGEGVRKNKLVKTDRDQAKNVSDKLKNLVLSEECEKSIDIFKRLMDLMELPSQEKQAWVARFTSVINNDSFGVAKRLVEVKKIQLDFWNKFGGDPEANKLFCQAVDFSNFEEEMSRYHGKKPSAMLRLMFSLLRTRSFDDRFDDQYFQIAEKRAGWVLGDFVADFRKFWKYLSDDQHFGDSRGVQNAGEKLSAQNKRGDNPHEKEIESAFCECFGMKDSKELHRLLTMVNKILETVASSAKPLLQSDELVFNLLPQMNHVNNASLSKLLLYALPLRGFGEWKKRMIDSDNENGSDSQKFIQQTIFEARRKLAMAVMLIDTLRYHEHVTEDLRNFKLEQLWEDKLVGPVTTKKLKYVYNKKGKEDGELLRVEETGKVSASVSGDVQETRTKKVQITEATLRKFVGKSGKCYASTETRVKGLDSCGRKVIVRDDSDTSVLHDIFGRAIVLTPASDSEEDLAYLESRESRQIEVCSEKTGKEVCSKKEVIDSPAVLDIIEKISSEEGVKIFDYSPTNRIASKGAGGGGDITLAKFYVRHTDGEGAVRWEEVQIFSPADGKGGFFWKQKKKDDDKRYEYARLVEALGRMNPDDPLLYQDMLTMVHMKK